MAQGFLRHVNHTTTANGTETGLEVSAHLIDRHYLKGRRISNAQMNELDIEHHAIQPMRNYTIYPRISRP